MSAEEKANMLASQALKKAERKAAEEAAEQRMVKLFKWKEAREAATNTETSLGSKTLQSFARMGFGGS